MNYLSDNLFGKNTGSYAAFLAFRSKYPMAKIIIIDPKNNNDRVPWMKQSK
jgi:hypothetical protein